MRKIIVFILVVILCFGCCIPASAASTSKPVYFSVYGLNQLNPNQIFAVPSSGKIVFVQVWDGNSIVKDTIMQPDHEYTLRIRVTNLKIIYDGEHPKAFVNGKEAVWIAYSHDSSINMITEATFDFKFHTPKPFRVQWLWYLFPRRWF